MINSPKFNKIINFYFRLPHFIGIGTQKGGTTTLHRLLEKHPEVYLPNCKEIQYFTLNSEKSKFWYGSHYKEAQWWQKRGDITPFYLFHPEVPMKIKTLVPQARLIVLLRDPAERTLSQIFHAQRHGFEENDVSQALDLEKERLETGNEYNFQKHSYLARSKYAEQLERYEKLFNSKQLLILKSEDFFNEPQDAWINIQDFLGLKVIPLTMEVPRANAGKGEAEKVDAEVRTRLRKELEETARIIKERYGIDWGW